MEPSRTRHAPASELHEIRLVGRGGTGVVTAGEVLGKAALVEGRWAQAIPTFGPERRGALSSCTLRISGEEILLKCGSIRPDVLVVIDRTIWRHAPVTGGLAEGATLIFNTPASPADLEKDLRLDIERYELFTVDANAIALEFLGRWPAGTEVLAHPADLGGGTYGVFTHVDSRIQPREAQCRLSDRTRRGAPHRNLGFGAVSG